MKLISILSICLFIYIKSEYNCIDINPSYSSDCVLSDMDLRNITNLKYCCYHEFEKYSNNYDYYGSRIKTTTRKCIPYNQSQYEDVKYDFDYNYYYDSYYSYYYGELIRLVCNNRSTYQTQNTQNNSCNSIIPSRASDCKLSSSESYSSNVCCYVKDSIQTLPYCKRYTKAEVNTETYNINSRTSTKSLVCISSQASFLKVSFLIIGILLL